MAGERLIKMLTERGGSSSEYSGAICDRVINASPLRMQISNSMIIDDDFVVLGKHIGSFSISDSLMTIEEEKGKDGEKPKTEKTIEPTTFTFDSSLEVGNKVTMVCADGSQQFYLFEREGG